MLIDLGTANSLAGIFKDGFPVTLTNDLGEDLVPPAVVVADDGTLIVVRGSKGPPKHGTGVRPAFFKRHMGTAANYRFGGRR